MKKMHMTRDVLRYFSEQQAILDEHIKKSKGIDEERWVKELEVNHKLALRVEVGEFINEVPDEWKYWKDKAPDLDNMLKEAVDIIHFIHLLINKHGENLDMDKVLYDYEFEIRDILNFYNKSCKDTPTKFLLDDLYYIDDGCIEVYQYCNMYATLLHILERYQFDLEDVKAAYDEKNKVNHDRQKQGY